MEVKTVTAYYCENGSFGNCDKQWCTYNEAHPRNAGANGQVFFCDNSDPTKPPLHVLKEDTKHGRIKRFEEIIESFALQGEFDFIEWAKDNEETRYKNVAKMHRVKCADNTKEETKCETKEGQQFKLDKTKVVIEKINPLKDYMEYSIEKKCASKAYDVCKKEGKDYDDVLNQLQIYFKRNLIRKLVQAINDLHALGYCHNDLKPDNIGISGKHEIKFIDMGSATPIKKGVVEAQTGEAQAQTQAEIEALLYTPNAKGYYLMRDTDLNKGGTFEYIPPMFSTSLGSLTHDTHRDKWSVGCIIYDIIKYNPNPDGKASTLFHHKVDPLLIALEHLKMNEEELNNKLDNEVFSDDEKTQFNSEIEKMKELMIPSLHETYTLNTDEAKVFEETYGITDFMNLKSKMESKPHEKELVNEPCVNEPCVNEPCVKLKKPDMYAQESISVQNKDPVKQKKKGRFTICEVNGTEGGCKKRGGGGPAKIVPGVETDETGEYIYITNPTAYREYLQTKEPPQGGGKKKHNTGKLITKERYDKEKKKLSKNVSHVRKYNTSKGFVYYLFKKS